MYFSLSLKSIYFIPSSLRCRSKSSKVLPARCNATLRKDAIRNPDAPSTLPYGPRVSPGVSPGTRKGDRVSKALRKHRRAFIKSDNPRCLVERWGWFGACSPAAPLLPSSPP